MIVELAELAVRAADKIKKTNGFIRVITHFDCDGICAGAIFFRVLDDLGKKFELCFVRQLEQRVLEDIIECDNKREEKPELYIFLDLGSGQLNNVKSLIPQTEVLVIDHHQPQNITWPTLTHLNPFQVGIDGKDEVSGAGLAYIVGRAASESARSLLDLTVVGATGDVQQQANGKFLGVNKLLVEDAVKDKVIKHEKGLRLFGRYTRPIHKAIEYWDEIIIPEMSGSESGAVQFLGELAIPLKTESGGWRTLGDLTKEEERRLATALVLEGACANGNSKATAGLIGDIYLMKSGYEVREFATLLNACGRIERPIAGLKLCLGEKQAVSDILATYKRKVASYLDWVRKNKERFMCTQNATYVFAQDIISENFIGTVMSMAVRSVFSTPVVFGFALGQNGIKVSARAKSLLPELNLGKAVKAAAEAVGGEGGGHKGAAGAKIPQGKEEEFARIVDNLIFARGETHFDDKKVDSLEQKEQNINKLCA